MKTKPLRCAIYTRKSTEEGLDKEFTSLDAQRESAEAYIKSQAALGWVCLPMRYDDGGFTGGNMERPALQRLLADIEQGHVNIVLTNKVDRLSRSLLDFARMMAIFDAHQVSFVSVTQMFNTATSMGRLVLNVLLSFAQFEREIISSESEPVYGRCLKCAINAFQILVRERSGHQVGGSDIAALGRVGPTSSSDQASELCTAEANAVACQPAVVRHTAT
jgi:hypothetical protein